MADSNDDRQDGQEVGEDSGRRVNNKQQQLDMRGPRRDNLSIRGLIGRRRPRPFPESGVLRTLVSGGSEQEDVKNKKARTALCPLLRDFFEAFGEEVPTTALRDLEQEEDEHDDDRHHEVVTTTWTVAESSDGPQLTPDSIDDSSLSTLTAAQHRRFLQLAERYTVGHHSWREPTRKEYRRLLERVRAEQHLYRRAIHCFWLDHPERRLSLGFQHHDDGADAQDRLSSATAFTRLALDPRLGREPTLLGRYGPCRQVLSLELATAECFASLSISDLSHRVLVNECAAPARSSLRQLPTGPQRIPGPQVSAVPRESWLRDDATALDLAQQHEVDIVASYMALADVLRHTHADGGRWMLPVEAMTPKSSSSRKICILEHPVPQPYSSPRDCLERGIQEGVCQWLENATNVFIEPHNSTQDPSMDGGATMGTAGLPSTPRTVQYQYSLLTIPSSSPTVRCTRVLIRFPCRLYHNNSVPSSNVTAAVTGNTVQPHSPQDHPSPPLSLHAGVEYFPERGREEASAADRALWVLDHICGTRSVVCRFDPRTCTCLGWEFPSLAHALADTSAEASLEAPMNGVGTPTAVQRWRTLACLVRAVRTVVPGRHVLCFPSRAERHGLSAAASEASRLTSRRHFLSASVHSEQEDGDLNVADEIDRFRCAESFLAPDGFRRSICSWCWESSAGERHEGRIPNTFPVDRTTKRATNATSIL